MLGGELRSTARTPAGGGGEWIVVEADESDRSLLKLSPQIAVLTNAELDHHSTYGSRLELEQTLREFMSRAGDGAVVWDRPELRALCAPGPSAYDAPDPALYPGGSRFEWRGIDVELSVPGAHNAVNAAGALTAAVLAGAEPARAARSLTDFSGARRRFELLGETARGVPVYDDYAHHPDRGRRGAGRGANAGADPADRGAPAALVLAHGGTLRGSSARRSRRRT